MLTVYCGENTPLSRKLYSEYKELKQKEGIEIKEIDASDIGELLKWQGENASLFASKTIYFTSHINKLIVRKRGKKTVSAIKTFEDTVKEIADSDQIELVVWEEKQSRELKIGDYATMHESKVAETIFTLLDQVYPANTQRFVALLHHVLTLSDENFIFIMLVRHIRSLILATDNLLPPTTLSWQKARLSKQAGLWKKDKLLNFYDGLYRLDLSTKTGTNAYGITKSLEILACHYL